MTDHDIFQASKIAFAVLLCVRLIQAGHTVILIKRYNAAKRRVEEIEM